MLALVRNVTNECENKSLAEYMKKVFLVYGLQHHLEVGWFELGCNFMT